MRRILLLTAFFSLSAFALAQHLGPRVAVNKLEYVLGTESNAEIDTVNFIISNAGDMLLKIKGIKSSCKCLTYSLEKNQLAAGEGAKLDVYYKNSSKHSRYKKEEYIYVRTNDPINPKLRLVVKFRKSPGFKSHTR